MALKRRLNRDIKERQVLLHKASLLCHFGRIFFYNRLLNDTILMPMALKLLPSKAAYPPDRGTEIKYFQSMVTWFKSAIKLKSQNLYPEKSAAKTKAKAHIELMKQIEKKEARCKQDMIFIFIILLRGMGLQCRLIVNMQPLPLKPAQSDLLTIKLKKEDENGDNNTSVTSKKIKKEAQDSDNKTTDTEVKPSTSKAKVTKQTSMEKEHKKEAAKKTTNTKNNSKDKVAKKDYKSSDNSEIEKEQKIKTIKKSKQNVSLDKVEEKTIEKKTKSISKEKHVKDTETKEHSISKTSETTTNIVKQTKKTTKENNKKHLEEIPKQLQTTKAIADNKSNEKTNNISKEKPKLKKLTEATKNKSATKNSPILESEVSEQLTNDIQSEPNNSAEDLESSQKENKTKTINKPTLSRLKRTKANENNETQEEKPNKRPTIEPGTAVIPTIIVQPGKEQNSAEQPTTSRQMRSTRSRSKSPQAHISTAFLLQNTHYKDKFPGIIPQNTNVKNRAVRGKSPLNKAKISTDFLKNTQTSNVQKRVLRSRQKTNEEPPSDETATMKLEIPQLDGADDEDLKESKNARKKRPNIKKLKVQRSTENSDEDFEPSPPKKPKSAPVKQDRRVLSTDDENDKVDSAEKAKRKQTAGDMWLEVWCDVEEQWVCVDIFKGKIHCVDTIRVSCGLFFYNFNILTKYVYLVGKFTLSLRHMHYYNTSIFLYNINNDLDL